MIQNDELFGHMQNIEKIYDEYENEFLSYYTSTELKQIVENEFFTLLKEIQFK
jgi:hypothetical protein